MKQYGSVSIKVALRNLLINLSLVKLSQYAFWWWMHWYN